MKEDGISLSQFFLTSPMALVVKRYRYVSIQANNFWAYNLRLERHGVGKQIEPPFPFVWCPRWVLLALWSA